MDLSAEHLKNNIGEHVQLSLQGSEEFLPFAPQSLDLILSPLTLHTVNDLPGALLQIRQTLKPDGLFLAAMLGGETLHELRSVMMDAEMNLRGGISPRIAPFADKPPKPGPYSSVPDSTVPVIDSEIITVTYENCLPPDARCSLHG